MNIDPTYGKLYSLYIGDTKLTTCYLDTAWGTGDYGLSAAGGASFTNFIVSTSTNVKITIADCSMSNDDLRRLVSLGLGVPEANVLGISRLGCSSKRDIQASEAVIVTFLGSQVENAAPTLSTSTSILSLEPSSVSAIPAITPGEIATFVTAGVGLTTGAIIAIVAGSVAGAGAIAGATVFAVKKLKKKPQEKSTPEPEPKVTIQEPQPEPKPQKKKPVGASINIFNLNPNDPQSITARAPPIKRNN